MMDNQLTNAAVNANTNNAVKCDVSSVDVSSVALGIKQKHQMTREALLKHLSATDKGKRRHFKAYLEDCRFALVRNVFLEVGAQEVNLKDSWIIAWVEGSIPMERFTRMKPYQKINHFPGMNEICKKDSLASNLKRMKKILPREYNFFPLTFCLPDEARSLTDYCHRRKKNEIFIIKPDLNCQGSGIDLVKGVHDFKKYRNVVCQKYIITPLLMDSFKLDLRLYVLVTSISPLRIYLYKEGLVRLATVPYKKPSPSNMHEKRMHLTNYAINGKSQADCIEEWKLQNCKKSFSDLEAFLDSLNIDHVHLWPTIEGIIVKTLLSALPALRHMFHTCFPMQPAMSPCFEILGFDVLLNNKVKPYLLEVNRSPSLGGSTSLDCHLKRSLVKNTLDMVLPNTRQISLLNKEQHMKAVRRLTNLNTARHLTARERIVSEYQEKREAKKMGKFRLVYPTEDGKYDAILKTIFSKMPESETTARHSSDCDSSDSD